MITIYKTFYRYTTHFDFIFSAQKCFSEICINRVETLMWIRLKIRIYIVIIGVWQEKGSPSGTVIYSTWEQLFSPITLWGNLEAFAGVQRCNSRELRPHIILQ